VHSLSLLANLTLVCSKIHTHAHTHTHTHTHAHTQTQTRTLKYTHTHNIPNATQNALQKPGKLDKSALIADNLKITNLVEQAAATLQDFLLLAEVLLAPCCVLSVLHPFQHPFWNPCDALMTPY
jgi:hypothetical protein